MSTFQKGDSFPATPTKAHQIADPLRILLASHGCTITPIDRATDTLTYPQGSLRTQLWPVTSDIRYEVILPGGIEIREVDMRIGKESPVFVSVVLDSTSTKELEEIMGKPLNT